MKKPVSRKIVDSAKGKEPEPSAKAGAAKRKAKPDANPKAKGKGKSVRFKEDADFMDVSQGTEYDDSDCDTSQVTFCSLKLVALVLTLRLNFLVVNACTACDCASVTLVYLCAFRIVLTYFV